MKVIFLDVDGILTYINSGEQNEGIDETRVERLKEIVDETDAKIVIISSWKGYYLKDGSYYKPKIYDYPIMKMRNNASFVIVKIINNYNSVTY